MCRLVYRKRYPRWQDEHIAGRCGTPHGCAEHKQGDLRSLVLGFSRIHMPVFPARPWKEGTRPQNAGAYRNRCEKLLRSVGRSEEHTSELQSLTNLVCRLLLEK